MRTWMNFRVSRLVSGMIPWIVGVAFLLPALSSPAFASSFSAQWATSSSSHSSPVLTSYDHWEQNSSRDFRLVEEREDETSDSQAEKGAFYAVRLSPSLVRLSSVELFRLSRPPSCLVDSHGRHFNLPPPGLFSLS